MSVLHKAFKSTSSSSSCHYILKHGNSKVYLDIVVMISRSLSIKLNAAFKNHFSLHGKLCHVHVFLSLQFCLATQENPMKSNDFRELVIFKKSFPTVSATNSFQT